MTMRACTVCKVEKPLTEFHKGRYHCKVCRCAKAKAYYGANAEAVKARARGWYHANIDQARARHRQHRKDNPKAHLKSHYKLRYGLTTEDVQAQVAAQGGNCAICIRSLVDIPERHVHVDHDHNTGAVRGVLCHWCNVRLGGIEANPGWLEAALAYKASGGVWQEGVQKWRQAA